MIGGGCDGIDARGAPLPETAGPAPTVSVLMLAYRHAPYVERCLDAIAAQTFTDFELIVVDDASGDDTPQVIRRWLDRTGFPARFIVNEQNLGASAARNLALSHARGEYLANAAADDFYEPTRLEHQVRCFATMPPEVAAIYSDMRTVDADGVPLGPDDPTPPWASIPPKEIFGLLIDRWTVIPSPAVMTRRAAVEALGGWDESLLIDDRDMWLRLCDRYEMRYCPGIVTNYRVLGTSISNNPERALARADSRVRLLLKWVDHDPDTRRRALDRAWIYARQAASIDRTAGRTLMRTVYAHGSTRPRALELAVASVPGGMAAINAGRRIRRRLRGR